MPWYRQMYNMNISRPVTITTHVSEYRGFVIRVHELFLEATRFDHCRSETMWSRTTENVYGCTSSN